MGIRLRALRRSIAGIVLGVTGLAAVAIGAAPARPAPRSIPAISDVLSHPVDVRPSMTVPSHLPLDGGRVTCMTCHDFERTGPGPRLRTGAAGPVSPAAFCAQCHDVTSSRAIDVHAIALGRAHYDLAPGARTAAVNRPLDGHDAESATCLSCHDGTLASGGTFGPATGHGAAGMRLRGRQHPIGVAQRFRGGNDHLVDPHLVDPIIRLFDGAVGCGSCHSPYAIHDDLLVVSNQGSGLCLSCHDF